MPRALQPLAGNLFLVDLGNGRAGSFSSVIFPPLALHADPQQPPLLQLRRAATGALDLYDWWDAARCSAATAGRTVTVTLLGPDLTPSPLRWRFTGARPVSLDYGALDASTAAPLSETLVLAYERVDIVR